MVFFFANSVSSFPCTVDDAVLFAENWYAAVRVSNHSFLSGLVSEITNDRCKIFGRVPLTKEDMSDAAPPSALSKVSCIST